MGRTPCCEKVGLNRGKWTVEEDRKLADYIKNNGEGSWRSLPKNAGLLRCGKSCRLRWINYLRTDVKRGNFTELEEETIVKFHKTLGNRWSLIASHLPGRTDNEIKNYWNSHLSRKIYRYRYIGEATLSASDMIKIVKKKKKTKKHGSDSADPDPAASESRISEDDDPSNAPPTEKPSRPVAPEAAEVGEDLVVLEPSRANEEGKSDSASSCDTSSSTMGWIDELMMSPNDAHEMDMLGPWSEVDDEMLMHLRYFLEDETTNQSQNEGDRVMMDADNTPTCGGEVYGGGGGGGGDSDGGWSSSLDSGDLYACLSPILSYFNDEQWDHNGVGNELNLWNEEDDISIWS